MQINAAAGKPVIAAIRSADLNSRSGAIHCFLAAAIYLGPKYQEGSVLGRQGNIPLAGAPIHFGRIAAVFSFLD
jgi:hypothetical protein